MAEVLFKVTRTSYLLQQQGSGFGGGFGGGRGGGPAVPGQPESGGMGRGGSLIYVFKVFDLV